MRPMQREQDGGRVRWVTTVRGFRVEGGSRRRCELEARRQEAVFVAWQRVVARLPETMRRVARAAGEGLVRMQRVLREGRGR